MGKINKALNRSNYKAKAGGFSKKSYQTKRQQETQQKEIVKEENKDLKLIQLSEDQQSRSDLKFVYALPQNAKEVRVLLLDKSEEEKLVIIQRVRDYYNPILDPQHISKFKQFIVGLITHYVQAERDSIIIKEHLQELCSQQGSLFSAFLKNKLAKVLQIIKEVRDSSNDNQEYDNILLQLIECQTLFLHVLECPNNSKLLEVLLQTTGHVYSLSKLFVAKSIENLLTLLSNDIDICGRLNKKFNPAINMILLKLLPQTNVHEKVLTLMAKHVDCNLLTLPSNQILTCELLKAIAPKMLKQKRAPLCHLRLQSKKPKELVSFNPFIDEEFIAAVMDDRKFKKRETDRDVKRKIKKTEKEAMRELRKDTTQIQAEKEKEVMHRNQIFKKSIIRSGNIKDDV